MTQPADLTHAVLHRLTQFVRRLSPQELSDLASGAARLDLVRPPANAAAAPARDAGVPADEVRSTLSDMSDRASAVQYLDGLRLTTPQLRALARELNLAVSAKASKTEVRDTIVQWTVGRRVDGAVLSRPT